MQKGAPSVNPLGRGAPIAKAKHAPGSDGIMAFGGYVNSGEGSSKLAGSQKWITYANAKNCPPVAVALLLRKALLGGMKWSLAENKAGGADAKRGLEVCQDGLFNARLRKPWPRVAAKAGNGAFFEGFSIHAFAMGRRKDGQVVFTDLAHRPQHTIERWLRKSDSDPFDAVEQVTKDGKRHTIPLSECLYIANDDIGDGPDGPGVLRLVVERIRRADNYEMLEGSEMFSSMGGMPIARAPLEEIKAATAGMSTEDAAAYKERALSAIREAVRNRIKTPEKQQYLVLDSATFQGTDPNTISSVQKYAIEILKGDLQGLAEARGVIRDEHLNVARVLHVEFAFIGGGDSSGSYGMHESKVTAFMADLQATADDVALAMRDQGLRKLVAANGLDPDTATPDLVPEKLTAGAVLSAMQAIALLQTLPPGDPIRNIVRERLEFPPEPEDLYEQSMGAPRLASPRRDVADVEEETPGKIQDAKPVEGETKKRAPSYGKSDRVVALVNHMEGMRGMAGQVVIARAGTPPYYGIRFDDQDAMPGTHKWLAEDEIEAETDDSMGGM